jgi:hypothetical protein
MSRILGVMSVDLTVKTVEPTPTAVIAVATTCGIDGGARARRPARRT